MSEPVAASRHPGRLLAWLCFVLGLTALNYLGRFAADDTPDDIAYQWTSSIGVVVQFGLMLGVLLLITIGLPKRELFALRRPRSWKRALGARRRRARRDLRRLARVHRPALAPR